MDKNQTGSVNNGMDIKKTTIRRHLVRDDVYLDGDRVRGFDDWNSEEKKTPDQIAWESFKRDDALRPEIPTVRLVDKKYVAVDLKSLFLFKRGYGNGPAGQAVELVGPSREDVKKELAAREVQGVDMTVDWSRIALAHFLPDPSTNKFKYSFESQYDAEVARLAKDRSKLPAVPAVKTVGKKYMAVSLADAMALSVAASKNDGLYKPSKTVVVNVTGIPLPSAHAEKKETDYVAGPRVHHCQICGRDILAKSGLIAHHGFQRPGDGWQTESCFGARHRPYEVAHDALDQYIPDFERLIESMARRLKDFQKNPPATLYRKETTGWGHQKKSNDITVPKPKDFDPIHHESHDYKDYAGLYDASVREQTRDIKNAKAFLDYMVERRAAWTAPTSDMTLGEALARVTRR